MKKILTVLPILSCLALTVVVLASFLAYVDVKPKVDEAFFFSSDDPQLRADKAISRIFPQPAQFVIGVAGDIRSAEYSERMRRFSEMLALLPEVFSVQSITHGPASLKDVFASPLWQRVLISEDGKSTFVSVFIREVPAESIVPKVEQIRDRFNRADFQVMISGTPYVVELISRKLAQDLRVFATAAFAVFGIVLLVIFRSFSIVLGTLVACINSSCLTLIVTHFLQIPIGPLTANLSTMVFVLTLSPMVFLTYNWKHITETEQMDQRDHLKQAIRMTILPSFWSMATTFLGFMSLLFVQATPMRQLGISGAIGTVVAFLAAYAIYPWFLVRAYTAPEKADSGKGLRQKFKLFFSKRHGFIAILLVIAAFFAGGGLEKVNTDPDLIAYFKKGSELRNGLEYIDRNGGSSPLKLVVVNQDGTPFNTRGAYKKLWQLQEKLEQSYLVGNVVSLPVILAEAKRSVFSAVLSTERLLKVMERPKFGEIAKYFVTPDRTRAFFLLLMKEHGRGQTPRLQVVKRIEQAVVGQGFGLVLMGGVYVLQGQLSDLINSSLFSGILLLLCTFFIMGLWLSRSVQVSGALLTSLALIPMSVLGLIGYLKISLDIISAPAINLAIGMGVDAMIYLKILSRRAHTGEHESWEAWSKVCSRLWQPISTSLVVVSAGFGIFLLSEFPPTQKFGFSVVLGSSVAAVMALFIFPWLATVSVSGWRRQRKN